MILKFEQMENDLLWYLLLQNSVKNGEALFYAKGGNGVVP